MVKLYLPAESVIVPLPLVLCTATASNGLRAVTSYTVPLMVVNCALMPQILAVIKNIVKNNFIQIGLEL